jgi:hypothetical protein
LVLVVLLACCCCFAAAAAAAAAASLLVLGRFVLYLDLVLVPVPLQGLSLPCPGGVLSKLPGRCQ